METSVCAVLSQADQETIDEWYKDSDVLFSVTINEEKREEAVYVVSVEENENCEKDFFEITYCR